MNNKLIAHALSFFILLTFLLSGCTDSKILSDDISKTSAEITVSFIDVGQGDSTLIECGGEYMLIDAGLYSGRYELTNYLSSQGVNNLKYCVATHPHSDHIGGMSQVIYTFDVDTLVYPEADYDSDSFNYVMDAADERGVNYDNPDVGDTYSLGGATLTVLAPEKHVNYSDNINNYSIVLKLEYEDVSFLFMGDAEKEIEKNLFNSGMDISADVLKCGHHGSSSSSWQKFVKKVDPDAAVISCGKNNDYGHPHMETLETLNDYGIKTFRTDESSTITAYSDGETITFSDNTNDTSLVVPYDTTSSDAKDSYSYIGNKNSKIFHTNDCNAIDTMKEKNKVNFKSRQDAIDKGYSPCGTCNP